MVMCKFSLIGGLCGTRSKKLNYERGRTDRVDRRSRCVCAEEIEDQLGEVQSRHRRH